MKQRRGFCDRLGYLVASMGLLFIGGALAHELYAVRGIGPETVLSVEAIGMLTGIKFFVVPTLVAIIGGGLWCFYQALKEE